MTTYAKLKLSDLEEAWENECSEVKDVLKRLYPTLLPPPTDPPEPQEINITDLVDWKTTGSSGGSRFLEGFHGGEQIVYVNPTGKYRMDEPGIQIAYRQEEKYKVVHCGGHTFKIIKIG